jgi:transcriptional regulator with XRE-family HTH domain
MLPAGAEARIRELAGRGQKTSAIKLFREYTGTELTDANHIVDALTQQLPPGRASEEESGWEAGQPLAEPCDPGVSLTESFAMALRRTRREAGDPSYRSLAHRTHYSPPTITRALSGRSLPSWDFTAAILTALGVPKERITTQWREMWIRARDQHRPLTLPGPARHLAQAQARHSPSGPVRSLTPPSEPGLASVPECEDCGALIGNLVQHQAWHWRIERQLRRTAIRAVDSTAQ